MSRYQKDKTNLDFTEAGDSEWQWNPLGHMQVCTSLQTDNHASTPPLSFLQAGCPSCRPTNSVKALKAKALKAKKIGHQSLRNNNYKNTIHHTLKIRLNISSHLSKYVGFFSHGNRSYSHSYQRSFSLIPIPKLESYSHSRGIPVPTGNLILYC